MSTPTSGPSTGPSTGTDRPDVVVVGAGFAGLYALHLLRQRGLDVRVFEAGDDVGGTWYWNRYPGARCDIESIFYSYSFDEDLKKEWQWSERYAAQPEILAYLQHVADRFDLRRDITLSTRVESAHFDEETERWTVTTDQGETVSAQHLVLGVGLLSSTNLPQILGRDDFAGPTYHTGAWPHEPVDFTGQRVGVIGTGSSGIQLIPLVAEQADHLTVFQRTANFSLPARNGDPDPRFVRKFHEDFEGTREQLRSSSYGILLEPPTKSVLEVSDEEREATYRERWEEGTLTGILQAYNDTVRNHEANHHASEFVRKRIAEMVDDPQVADDLTPRGYAYGTKRPCLDTNYYATYNRDNVTLVNVRRDPIERITATGIIAGGTEHELDALVFATGYDAMTGPLLGIDIRGRDGARLADKWENGPVTYLGISTAGFPNMYMICGPGSPSALSNAVVSIEQHVEWVADLLTHLEEQGIAVVEAEPDAEVAWTEHVQVAGRATLYPETDSWYMGANIPGKPRVFLPYIGGVGYYREHCAKIAADGYPGFALRAPSTT
ncbi:flavin-containing monooxygenase [Nocardioides massiliensis]|uniref:Cation diffusion facilitator CzcD-associated flavoprotein CzcO n=1 Tax=Nocardioides massiliensis TaxID=1325935 RepID=A0ABT9NU42_9ACTN|nr:NAD(P)/FAD-dependent oxidoreductase [Nocardioides massiliensis]MDP9823944.1 cation diffusion facilitator CzcD-associated flavoprotein CzcO [Nocardioides massiliensis]